MTLGVGGATPSRYGLRENWGTCAVTDPEVRITILEDDPVIRRHLEDAVRGQAGLVLAASAGSLADADVLIDAAPDVALVDLGLPDGSGIEFIARLQKATSAKAIVITIFRDRDSVMRSLEAGADGYLLKDSTPDQVVAAIRAALDGGAPISPEAARHLLQRFEAMRAPVPDERALTVRETELLEIFARGLSYREAAQALGISRHTVGDHVKSIYRKLSVNSRSEAVFEATQSGLIHPHR
ncbi:response regulator transcription factor [Sphingomonas sp. AOB5]|uniref:response regulator n=1 Tax=Sphingomonas sp. AOB5 TaxID=3034017 RepID=UPI0023F686A3|nr:response regulator transcription factor [Sphingomonas sp. AOB5]MDF7776095.1 response regulator transcription factor [Sphingomonas sp. AOB5]